MSESDQHSMMEALHRMVSEERRFPVEAYLFLYQALDYAQRLVGERRHVSGQELLDGIRKMAIELFGPLTLMVFDNWKVTETADFGRMVFHLVDRELMGKTDDDKIEDFEDAYDFQEVFAPERLMSNLDPKCLEPSVRLDNRKLPGTRARAHA